MYYRIGIILVSLYLALLCGCGHKINKQALSADEYFEFAKQKFDNEDYLEAITEFTVITLKFSADPVVDDAQYYLAESHFEIEEYLVAISEYEKLINDYPQSPYGELAQFKIGMCYYDLSPRSELDQEYTRKALRQFNNFVEENPNHELTKNAQKFVKELRQKLAKKKMLGARTYRKMGIYDSAVIYYNIVLEEYGDLPQAKDAMYWKGECLYKMKKYKEAFSTLTVYIEKYPNHHNIADAKNRLAEISEKLDEPPPNAQTNLNGQDDI
ncbi:MAG: outer membrane protein assembly factor BamD [Nitrosopumilaceae archaeon]|nr:outer membrane protein assembly factor BamD [Nitrosopumilaceae archaeon]NIX62246.1 outer membrane protein assembly factor BamD [Nitrosopumilaceae archaeon]